MNEKWIEIFKGGKQTDSNGVTHTNCDQIIDSAVQNFNSEQHEPPVVIGHPNDNAPAYGWVESLKSDIVDGVKTLYAKFKDIQPEFKEWYDKKLYKKRSASFYPDGTLRHVGFLGASPPAIKGLKDAEFKENKEYAIFEFNEQAINKTGNIVMTIPQTPQPSFSEQENRLRAEFAERTAELQNQLKRQEITHWAEKIKIPPAWLDDGLLTVMMSLDDQKIFNFSEGKRQNTLQWFQEFIEKNFDTSYLFTEFAKKGKTNQDNEYEKIGLDIARYVNGG